jgi:hypothetical protein
MFVWSGYERELRASPSVTDTKVKNIVIPDDGLSGLPGELGSSSEF